MKSSGIGGQAVMEGVMMRNNDRYAVSVRKSDGTIVTDVKPCSSSEHRLELFKAPIIRGVVAFVDSLKLGLNALSYSASFIDDEESAKKKAALEALTGEEREKAEAEAEKKEKQEMALTLVLSILIAVVIFMLVPFGISQFISRYIESGVLLAVIEGVIRVIMLVGYIFAISKMKEIHRVFCYHGAEHKCINCIENGLELTVENVRKQSREHRRCGTSFLLVVALISVIVFIFIRTDIAWLRLVLRIVFIPVIAGISYEFIRFAGNSDSAAARILSKPGMWLQGMTTCEPEDDMIEVGIASVVAVFDVDEYLVKFREDREKEEARKAADEAEAARKAEAAKEDAARRAALLEAEKEAKKHGEEPEEGENTDKPKVAELRGASRKEEKKEVTKKSEAAKTAIIKPERTVDTSTSRGGLVNMADEDESDEILKALDTFVADRKKRETGDQD